MIVGIILFVVALLLILYAVGCWAPGQASRREEELFGGEEDGK